VFRAIKLSQDEVNKLDPQQAAESIAASIPVIVSKNVAMHHFVDRYKVGVTIESLDPNLLSQAVLNLTENYAFFKENCIKFRELLDWSTVFVEWEKIIILDNELVI
jgi:glycosyltransferase involved in cell wall biosynthesis